MAQASAKRNLRYMGLRSSVSTIAPYGQTSAERMVGSVSLGHSLNKNIFMAETSCKGLWRLQRCWRAGLEDKGERAQQLHRRRPISSFFLFELAFFARNVGRACVSSMPSRIVDVRVGMEVSRDLDVSVSIGVQIWLSYCLI